jgi:hypothetical protein
MRNVVLWMVGVACLSAGCGGKPEEARAHSDNLVVPERAGLFTEATEYYGALVVRSGEYYARAGVRPWSGYWYPLKDDLLVKGSARNGGRSTLEKVDQYSKAVLGRVSTAVDEEKRKHLYNPMADSWEGRCGAWAVAAVMEPEPVLPKEGFKVPGTDLTLFTRDLKALVIKSYETVDNSAFRRFGQVYQGDPKDDYQDLYPDQFHRVMMAELFDRHRPFVLDDTAGTEVWNTPVWAALTTLTPDGSDPHLMHVYTRIKGAQSVQISPDYAGPSNDTTYQLTYDLIGLPQADGSFVVKYGKWTDESFEDHPDFVLSLPDSGVKVRHASLNTQLDEGLIQSILSKVGLVGTSER